MEIVRIFSASLTPVIGVLAVYIAWQQYRTARDKLKLDLYERRFRVYRGLMDLLGSVLLEDSVSREALGKYYSETDEKRFLFDSDVTGYMKAVREKAVRLRQVSRKIEGLPENREKDRDAAITENSELLAWFDQQVEEASHRFENYLAFKKNL